MAKNEYICDCNAVHQEKVDNTRQKMPTDFIFDGLAGFYKIIGDKTRCKLLFALLQNEMCVCDLANVLSMTKSSISHQLAKMKDYGVVKSRREGKEVYYSLDDEHISEIFEISIEHIKHKL